MSWPASPLFSRLICSADQVRYLLVQTLQFMVFLSLEGVKREVKPSSLLVMQLSLNVYQDMAYLWQFFLHLLFLQPSV